MHGEQQRRAIEEHDREHVEGVVEEVAVADREGRRPVEVREDAEGHGFREVAEQQRADEAQHQVEPDRRGEGPGYMRAHTQRAGAPVGPEPPQQDRCGEEEARHLPPAALAQRRQRQAVLGRRRLEAEPEQLAHELDRVPVHRGQHVEADDLDRHEAAEQRHDAERTEVDGSELRIADDAEQPVGGDALFARPVAWLQRHAIVGGAVDLNAGEDVLIFDHHDAYPLGASVQIGRSSHQFHHSGQPRVQNGPEITMQTALKNTAPSARNSPSRWMPSVPIE